MNSERIPSVGIVIINWNNYEDSKKCLISLINCTYSNFKTIVVDNFSQDGSGERLNNEFGNFAHFIFNKKNLGFTGGNNVGLRYALAEGFEYVMELNNDTEVEPDFLTKLVFSVHGKKEYGAAQPLIYYNQEKRHIIWNAGGTLISSLGLTFTKFKGKKKPDQLRSSETDWITGCAFLIRSEVLKKTGLLKEFYFFGSYEDVDLSTRIRKAGYKLWFEPSSVIYHSVAKSSKSPKKGKEGNLNSQVHYLVQRNQMIFINQQVPKIFIPLAVIIQCGKMLFYSVYFIARWRPTKLKLSWKGFKDGLMNSYND